MTKWITLRHAASLTGRSTRTIAEYVRRGRVRAEYASLSGGGTLILVDRDDVVRVFSDSPASRREKRAEQREATLRAKDVLRPSEQEEHSLLADWLDAHGLVWFHPPLGGYRRKVEAAILHGLGARAGVPDFIIFSPPPLVPSARGAAIELKRRGRDQELFGGVSPEQHRWIAMLHVVGWCARVCYGADEAISWLESLGYGRRTETAVTGSEGVAV